MERETVPSTYNEVERRDRVRQAASKRPGTCLRQRTRSTSKRGARSHARCIGCPSGLHLAVGTRFLTQADVSPPAISSQ